MADSYIFDANAGDTQAKLARRRALLEAVLGRARRTPKNLGEGIDAAGEDIGAALGLNRVGAQEAAFERGSKETVRSLPEGSLASGDGFSTPGASATSKDGDTNRTDARVQMASNLTPDASGKYSASDAIAHFESGGRNIAQQVIGPQGGYNPSVGKVTGPSSASGIYQITNPTWRSAAAMAGVDTKQYPTAMSAPAGQQKAAQQALFAKEGFGPWAPYNPALRNFIRSKGGPGAFKNADAGSEQKIAAAYGYNGPPADASQVGPGAGMVGDQPDARVASLSADSNIATDAMPPAAVGPQGYEQMKLEDATPAPVSREALAATLAQTEPPQEQAAQLPIDAGAPPQEAYRGEGMPVEGPPMPPPQEAYRSEAAPVPEPMPPAPPQEAYRSEPMPPQAAPVPPVPPVPPSRPAPPPQAPVAAQPTRQMLARAMSAAPPPLDGQPEGGMNVRQALEDHARRQGGMGFMPPAAPVPLAAPAGAPAGIKPPVPAGATQPPQAAPPAVAEKPNPADVPPATATEAQGQMTSAADAKDAAVVKAADNALRDKPMTKEDRGYVEKLRTEALTRIEKRRTEARELAKEERTRQEAVRERQRQEGVAASAKKEEQRLALEKEERERAAKIEAESPEKKAKDKLAVEVAEQDAKFVANYKTLRDTARMAEKNIRDAEKHPGLEKATGMQGNFYRNLPAGDARDYMPRHMQLTSQAFLKAYADLKGGGAITEAEGNKAAAAIARMDLTTSTTEYRKALNELKGIVENGLKNARARAGKFGLKHDEDEAPLPSGEDHASKVSPGEEYNGQVFLGGNWKDPKSWRPL